MAEGTTHRIAVLAIDGVAPIDLAIPVQVFTKSSVTSYSTLVCASTTTVRTSAGFDVSAPGSLEDVARADTIVVPGYLPPTQVLPQAILIAIADAAAAGRRMMSICVGAFALAAAGVLNGRRVTTHWDHAAQLAARYPAVTVDPAVLYVDDGAVLTSAGVAAGMDLCLHIIRRDYGPVAANTVARQLVAAPHRSGGQAQFIERPVPADDRSSLADLRAWARLHLAQPLSITELARRAGLSERTLTRRFRAETGAAPLQWLQQARLERARRLLETDDRPMDQIAADSGLGTAANLRLQFRRSLGTTPTAYRLTFR